MDLAWEEIAKAVIIFIILIVGFFLVAMCLKFKLKEIFYFLQCGMEREFVTKEGFVSLFLSVIVAVIGICGVFLSEVSSIFSSIMNVEIHKDGSSLTLVICSALLAMFFNILYLSVVHFNKR